MTTNKTLTAKLFAALLSWGGPSTFGRKAANLIAGWLALVGLAPPLPKPPPSTWKHVLAAALLIPVALIMSAPGLNFAQPVLRAAGTISAEVYAWASFAAINLWRYRAGQKVLTAFEATQQQGAL